MRALECSYRMIDLVVKSTSLVVIFQLSFLPGSISLYSDLLLSSLFRVKSYFKSTPLSCKNKISFIVPYFMPKYIG